MKLPMRGPWRRAEQGFVKRLEPVAQALERVALADFEHDVLDFVARRVGRELGQLRVEVLERFDFMTFAARGAAASARRNRGHN